MTRRIKKNTQQERILKYMDDFGSISPNEAFTELGITKLATRISELKRMGYEFKQRYESSRNRYGETVYYMRYWRKENGTDGRIDGILP